MCPKSNSQKVNEPGFELRQFPLCCTIEISPKFQVIVILSSGLQIYICVLWQKGDTTNSSKALGNSFPDSQLRRTLFPKNRLPRASLPLRLVPFCNSPFAIALFSFYRGWFPFAIALFSFYRKEALVLNLIISRLIALESNTLQSANQRVI